jgi:hypothetical protein
MKGGEAEKVKELTDKFLAEISGDRSSRKEYIKENKSRSLSEIQKEMEDRKLLMEYRHNLEAVEREYGMARTMKLNAIKSKIYKSMKVKIKGYAMEQKTKDGTNSEKDDDWYERAWEGYKTIDHSKHFCDMVPKVKTLFRFCPTVPNELCSVCISVMKEVVLETNKNKNPFVNQSSRVGNLNTKLLIKILDTPYGRRMLFDNGAWVGAGNRKIHGNKYVKNARDLAQILEGFGVIKGILVRQGGVHSDARKRQLISVGSCTNKDIASWYRYRERDEWDSLDMKKRKHVDDFLADIERGDYR